MAKQRQETLPEAITAVIAERAELIETLLSLLVPHDKLADTGLAHKFGLSFEVIHDARDVAEKYRE